MTLLGIEYTTLIRIVDVSISVLTAAFSTIFVLVLPLFGKAAAS
jgi:hypothetical protein